MIKIRLSDKVNYSMLQNNYLQLIAKYIEFDKADIISDSDSDKLGKTEKTADKLMNTFPELYKFLYYDGTKKLNQENLRYLLVGPYSLPQSMGGNDEVEKMYDCFVEIVKKCPLPDEKVARDAAKKCCEEIFQYEKFRADQQAAHCLLRMLNVRVCPYCNRVYTVTLPSKQELEMDESFKATRATFDHFYSQSQFPQLALSLFNLIPSCHWCNLNKGSSRKEIVYPYDEEFGKEAVFRVIPDLSENARSQCNNVLSFLHGESEWFHIKFLGKEIFTLNNETSLKERLSDIEDEEFRERIENSIDLFHLEELYKEHMMEVKDILKNNYLFNKEYVRTVICPLLLKKNDLSGRKNNDIDFKTLEEMAMDMLYFSRTNQKEWGKRPLSKLVSDILEQVEVF